mmetsp:Transcript_72041/g.166883  ORF Transcript_72041/g.166883 Transcript_72041/m.166883 type:complete len:322 (+) Transcript_72041:59-1024(+)
MRCCTRNTLLYATGAGLGLLPRLLAVHVRWASTGSGNGDTRRDNPAFVRNLSLALDRELVNVDEFSYRVGDTKLVVMTSANTKYIPLTLNLYSSMRRVGREKLLVFCEDGSCEPLRERQHHGLHVMSTGNNFADAGEYDSPSFNFITGMKPAYIQWFLRRGHAVLWTDGDISWVRDPVALLASINSSIVTQDDGKFRGKKMMPDDTAVDLRHPGTGFFFVRPTELGMRIMARWFSEMDKRDPKLQDQTVFNTVFHQECKSACSQELEACDPETPCMLLSRRRWPNGSVPPQAWRNAVIYHANWRFGVEKKVALLRESGLWL